MEIAGFDKILHVAVSYLLALIDPAIAVAAGLGKEAFDLLGGGVADIFDLVADAVGILLAI